METDATPPSRGGLLAKYLQEQFRSRCPAGWRCTSERPLLAPADRRLLGYDPRADVLLEREDGGRRIWIEFEISRADPAANHAKFATAHVLRPWTRSDAFVSMISAHVARGRRNLAAGMIQVMRQVGIDAFQTLLLPRVPRDRVRALNHDAAALRDAAPDAAPEIERALTVAEPVAATSEGRLHLAADVFDVLVNVRQWNDEAADPALASTWRRRAVRYVVLDPSSGLCAPAKFAAYVVLGAAEALGASSWLGSRMTLGRYVRLDHAEPLFDGHRAWTHLTGRLAFASRRYGERPDEASAFDAWYARHERLVHVERERLRILVPPASFS